MAAKDLSALPMINSSINCTSAQRAQHSTQDIVSFVIIQQALARVRASTVTQDQDQTSQCHTCCTSFPFRIAPSWADDRGWLIRSSL